MTHETIYTQQMGAAASTNIAKTTATVISRVTNSVVQDQAAKVDQEQSIIVKNVTGDVVIDNVVQKISATLDMRALFSSIAATDVKQSLAFELAQAAKAFVKDINFGNVSVATNDVENVITETIDIATNLNQHCASTIDTKQNILIDTVTGDVQLENIKQDSIATQVLNCALTAISNSVAVNDLQQKIDQQAAASTVGVSVWGIATILGIIVLGLAVVFVGPVAVPFLFAAKRPQLLGVLFVVVSIAFFIMWALWTSRDVSMTLWAQSLQSTCANSQIIGRYNVNTADEAARLCIENSNAVAFDFCAVEQSNDVPQKWQPIAQPYTILYSRVDRDCLQNIRPDQSPVLTTRTVYVSNTQAEPIENTIQLGDVWINTSNATLQTYIQINIWSSPKVIDIHIPYLARVQIPRAIFVKPMDTSEQLPSLTSDNSLLTLVLVTETNETLRVKGPGYVVDRQTKFNVSGKIIKKHKMWALYVGIGLFVIGILFFVFFKPKNINSDGGGEKVVTGKK